MNSSVLYSGNGVQTAFVVAFLFLAREHVKVFVGGVEDTTHTWTNDTTIEILPAPPAGTLNVLIRRNTPTDAPLVDFADGAMLSELSLDTATRQAIFIAQEFFELPAAELPAGHTIDSHTDATPGESVAKGSLRVYASNSKLHAVAPPGDGGILIGDTVQSNGLKWLAKGTDGQTLEVDDSVFGKLAWKQGLRKLVTTAGDLLAATASGVLARLAIGANNAVLVVDTTVGTVKMAWKTTLAGLTLTSPVINTPTISAPALSGSITGTYTLAGTPTHTLSGTLIVGTGVQLSPWAVSVSATSPHLLGAVPSFVSTYIECLTAELGYSVGDRVHVPHDSASATGWSIVTNATSIIILTNGSAPAVINKTTQAGLVAVTAARWKVVVTPYLIRP